MSCLIDDLLKLGKVNRQQLSLRDVGLRHLVEEVVHELEAETANRKIDWRIETLPVIQCDRGLMKQVLTNLISNAIKYSRTRDPAIIEVRGVFIEGESTVLVRDNGVGFDLTSAEKLFSPFQRFHRAEEFEGTGIGLATVQRIIDKHRDAFGPLGTSKRFDVLFHRGLTRQEGRPPGGDRTCSCLGILSG